MKILIEGDSATIQRVKKLLRSVRVRITDYVGVDVEESSPAPKTESKQEEKKPKRGRSK